MFGWRVGAMVVAVTAAIAQATFRADPPVPPRFERMRGSPSKDLIVEFDAAQKAWALRPTPDTAWARADALETLAGAEVAASAWDDYLQLDSTSPRAQEARRRQKVVTVTSRPLRTTELDLTGWAKAVLGGSVDGEKRALAALTAQGKGQQLFTGDAFLADVAGWLASLANDRASKVQAADAILLLQSGGKAVAVSDFESAEHKLQQAMNRLREMHSPLATISVVHLAGALHSRGRSDRAAAVFLIKSDVCTAQRRYLAACGAQTWLEGLIDLDHGRSSEALSRFSRALDKFARSGDASRQARLLVLRAATLDSMRSTDEAWVDRIRAIQLASHDADLRDSVLRMLAIAATRDGYHYAADHLFSQVERSDADLARWRAVTRAQIAGDGADPNLQLAALGMVWVDGTFIHANASFTSNRRDVVRVSLQGTKAISLPPRSDWSAPVDEFVPAHIQREALGVMAAETVRHLYEDESRTEVANGSAEAALWLSDRARTVGVPMKEIRACISEHESASAADMGKRLVACVPAGVTIVYQDLDEARLYTWVIRGGHLQLTTTWVSAPQLIADMQRFRSDIAAGASVESVRRQAQELYDVLLRPVQQQIAGSDLLVYSPSPNLRGIPVILLHDGERLLIETRPVVTTPTLSAFELPQAPATNASALVVLPQSASRNVLSGAHIEARVVARIYQKRSTELFEAAATPKKFFESVGAHEVIHVATHGHTRGAPYQNSIEFGEDSIRAYDIFTLKLTRKPIVMLAACRTADSSGGPMNVGLTDAFLAAGASAVVGSLWDVEDHSTEQLSIGFHRELAKGATPQDALRRVQLQFIRQGRPLSTWAAFQVSS